MEKIKNFTNLRRMLIPALLMAFSLAFIQDANATHFRYGTISWRQVQGSANTIEFKVEQAWRLGFFSGVAIGASINVGTFNHGDASSRNLILTVTSINAAEGWFYGTSTFIKTYTNTGSYSAYFNICCRISTLQNNSDGNVYNYTTVNVGSNNNSPVSSLLPIINVPAGMAAATFQIPATDPDGNSLTYRLATSSEMGVSGYTQPSGFSINSTGLATFNTVGKTTGQLYNASVMIEDGLSKIPVDFIIRIVSQSTPPIFDYSVTPTDGYTYRVSPGQNINFTVLATDADPGDIVHLQAVGLPVGPTFSPSIPTSGNPVSTTFNWTPLVSNLGTYVISFVAQDLQGVQVFTSVSIIVSMKPVFDVPPTPAYGSHFQFTPRTLIEYTFQASDPDPNDVVQIINVDNFPSSASLTPSLPSPAANPTSTEMSWVPAVSDWGKHDMEFTAEDSYGDQVKHTLTLVINTPPVISSLPITTANVGELYIYEIDATDPDVTYGDNLIFLNLNQLPAWITLTDNGDGTATLSGTPSLADLGPNNVDLIVEDIYHHGYDQSVSEQHFIIEVENIVCTMTVDAGDDKVVLFGTNAVSNENCVDLTAIVTDGTAGYTYIWTSNSSYVIPDDDEATITVCPTIDTEFTVVVTDANGCSATATVNVKAENVSCGNGPNNKTSICHLPNGNPGNPVQICVSNNAVESILTNSPGSYVGSCIITNKNNSLDASEEMNKLDIYPNPASGVVFVNYSNIDVSANRIVVMDISGKVIISKDISDSSVFNLELNITELPQGVYVIAVTSNGQIIESSRFIKN